MKLIEILKHKGLERDRKALPQAFSVTQEAFAWMKIAHDTLLFFRLWRRSVVASFDQEHGSSDGGASLLKAADRPLGLSERRI